MRRGGAGDGEAARLRAAHGVRWRRRSVTWEGVVGRASCFGEAKVAFDDDDFGFRRHPREAEPGGEFAFVS